MLLRARDNNIQSFAFIWLFKGNQNEFLKHRKIKRLDGELEILVYRWKANKFFIITKIEKRIYIKRFNEFAFVVVSFNLQNFVVFPID